MAGGSPVAADDAAISGVTSASASRSARWVATVACRIVWDASGSTAVAGAPGELWDSAAMGLDWVWSGLAGELDDTPVVDMGLAGSRYRRIGELAGAVVVVVGVTRGRCRAAGKHASTLVTIVGLDGLGRWGVRGLVGSVAGLVGSIRVIAVGTRAGSLPTFLVVVIVWVGGTGIGKLVSACLGVGKVG